MFLTILIIAIVFSIAAVWVTVKYPKSKNVFQLVYLVGIILLGYLLISNIRKPIKFNEERKVREEAAVSRLKDIRTAQVAFKDKYGHYTASFDTLINFVKTDSFDLERLVQVEAWNQDEMTKEEAIKTGILQKSIIQKAVKDSLFAADYPIDRLRYIPQSNNSFFVMGAGEVETGSKVKVKVFEAYALYDTLFKGMDKQLVINYKEDRYKLTNFTGVKVGSLTEANNNAGNWEK